MKPLFTELDFKNAKSKDKLPCECYHCNTVFLREKTRIKSKLKENENNVKYCSPKCQKESKNKRENVICINCGIEFIKESVQIIKSPNHFCSRSCSASYNNKHKSHGNRRSKLENWLEEELTVLYPNLQIDYNKKTAIQSELDIYIPSLNLAFELNGIFHYEPIYGIDKLNQIKENDISKSKACHEAKIDLCIIDTAGQSYFKTLTSQKYLDIITNIINKRI